MAGMLSSAACWQLYCSCRRWISRYNQAEVSLTRESVETMNAALRYTFVRNGMGYKPHTACLKARPGRFAMQPAICRKRLLQYVRGYVGCNRGQSSAVICTFLFPAKTSSRAQVRRSRTSSKRLRWRRDSKNQVGEQNYRALGHGPAHCGRAYCHHAKTFVDPCHPKGHMWLECAVMVWNGRRALLGDVEVLFSQEELLRC